MSDQSLNMVSSLLFFLPLEFKNFEDLTDKNILNVKFFNFLNAKQFFYET